MKNTYVSIILVALLFVSCGRAAKKTTVKEPVSEEALLEQVAEEENLSEFERTQFVPTLDHFRELLVYPDRQLKSLRHGVVLSAMRVLH